MLPPDPGAVAPMSLDWPTPTNRTRHATFRTGEPACQGRYRLKVRGYVRGHGLACCGAGMGAALTT